MTSSNGRNGVKMPGQLKDAEDGVPRVELATWKGAEGRILPRSKPSFVVRVPGRVNLIGEHVDYCGYGVFPMAIEQDVFVGVWLSGGDSPARLTLSNTGDDYPTFSCLLKDVRDHLAARVPGVAPPWHLYYLCGVLGVLEHLGLEDGGISCDVVVDGRVPARAGLSSSSALVCAAALATLVANRGEMARKELASLCAASERWIGTQGGGMDQAIAFLATAGTAQRIEFVPELAGEKVGLPTGSVFVIANSLVEANKAASDGYNVRVAECRLATWVLARAVGQPFLGLEKVKQLHLALVVGVEEMLALVETHIHKEPYTAAEIAGVLGLRLEELLEKPLMNRIPLEQLQLKLWQRISHVLQEAARVEEFHAVCSSVACPEGRNGHANASNGSSKTSHTGQNKTLARLGQLMNGSHTSLRDLYECSHPRLDKLVGLAQSEAYGARLTGAGWGGCMVALCDEGQLQGFLARLKREYYMDQDMGPHVFVTQPGAGATILE